MSQATAPAFDQVGAHDAFEATRANYERFAFLLLRAGHVPDLPLSHLECRVLLFLLAQKPGAYAAHQRTIAKACDSNTTSIRQALGRLRAAGLVLWEIVRPHHKLPTGRFTRTNVNRYWVNLSRLAVLEAPVRPLATAPKPAASTQPESDASYGTDLHIEHPPPFPPNRPALRAEEEAFTQIPIEPEAPLAPELQPICDAWNRIGLGLCDSRERRALGNRMAEGATCEQLEAAVAGAGADDWLRRRAKVPFAVVFASLASVERFAHEGRKILDAKAGEARREAEERRKDREWREHERLRAANAEPPPPRDELRAWLPTAPPQNREPARPMTHEELARRRAEQIAAVAAWGREAGLE